MKMKFKRITKFILAASAITAPVSLAVSCANEKNYGDSWELKSHRNINLLTPNADGINETYGFPNKIISFGYDKSSVNSFFNNSQQIGLFSKVKDNYDLFEKTTIKKETFIKSKPQRKSFLKFDLIKSVKLNFQNNKSETFDSDSIDVTDKKSVNGNHFINSIKKNKLKTMEFEFQDDIVNGKKYWTEEITGNKRGKLKTEDIWSYFQMSIYSNSRSREQKINEIIANGADDLIGKINSYVNKKAHWEPFKKSDNTSSKSQWISNRGEENFGLDFKKFLNTPSNKKDFLGITNSNKKSSKIVIPFTTSTTGNKQLNFWKSQIKNFNIFATPTDNIKYLTKKYTLPRNLFNSDKEHNDFINSDLYKTGIFSWYMAQEEKDYVAGGKYYMSKNDKKIRELKANPNYIHYDDFFNNLKNSKTNKKTTILSVSENFIQESNLSNTIILQAYKEGFTTWAETKTLSSKDYNNMLSNPKKWGMNFSSGYTSDSLFGDFSGWQILPGSSNPDVWDEKTGKMVKGKNNYNVYFNDWYAKVMWGHPIKDLIKQQVNNDPSSAILDWADNYYGGTGIQFMTNLLAALNSYTAVHNFDTGFQEWNSILAPENPIEDYSNKYKNNKVIYQAHPELLDDDDNRKSELLKTTSKFGLSIYKNDGTQYQSFKQEEIPRKEYMNVNINPNLEAIKKYGPPSSKINFIKNNIKTALDVAKVPKGQKVTFEWPIARLAYDIKMNFVYEKAIKWLNSLDPRLNIVAMLEPRKENIEEYVSKIIQKDYTKDFNKINESVGNTPPPWIDRLYAAQGGYGAINLNHKYNYEINSPAGGIFSNIGYLQTGKLMGLSYYADHKDLIKDNILEGLNPLIEVSTQKFDNLFKNIDPNDYESSQIQGIITKLKNTPPKFNELYKNSIGDMVSYDFYGMHGFEDFKDLLKSEPSQNKKHKDYIKIRNDIDKFSSRLSGLFNSEFMNEYQLKIEDNEYDQISVLKSITAFNVLTPTSLNPLVQRIGNRKNPGIKLMKNWLFTGTDTNQFLSYEWYRVDLYKNERGEIQGGGIL